MERAAAGGRRTRVGDHRRAGHIALPSRQQVRLEVQDAAGTVGVPGDEGPPVLLHPGQSDRRLERAEHDAVRTRQPPGLRQLGEAGQPRLVVRRSAAVLQEVAGPAEPVPGQEHPVPRHRGIPHRAGLALEHSSG